MMHSLDSLTLRLGQGQDLPAADITLAAQALVEASVDPELKKQFLLALAQKGESSAEVAGFAAAFRNYAINPGVEAWADRAIDVCGTGGDGSGTFNISTAVSFLVAAAGVPVFKHGNRSITSKCGSADLMEALGIRLDAPHEMLRESLEQLNFCFFFAPAFHPAFKEIMPVRKALAAEGKRTIFNLLGPLINPGRPAYQLLGVFSKDWVQPLADALGALELKAGMVAHGTPREGAALDELSCAGTNYVAGFGALANIENAVTASTANLPSCDFDELAGGDVAANLQTMEALLSGASDAVPAGLRNSVLLNAGAALWIAEQTNDMASGVKQAEQILSSGQVARWLDQVRAFYA
ncbi:MAG: anthranilate phosphoribosyltransferase [Opitutales bacterium]|nr:anthranilate phosphoribosyltransferase [Opitutales bacterium]MDP4778205.1 anthranilate phosphoribosyltransferase [Opitutales bacterium]